MVSPAISVIVPVYNTEKYLERCLSSLTAQSFRDFEAIIVDDGSTDGSPAIMRRHAEENPKLICVYKENGGQASARNLALSMARGRYIAFLDSDDFYEPDYLLSLYEAAEKSGADISVCSFYRAWEESTRKMPVLFHKKPGIYGHDNITGTLLADFFMHSYLWDRLWKREIFDGFTFSDMRYEDLACIIPLTYRAEKISVISKPLYNYVWRKGATSKSINPHNSSDYIRAILLIRHFLGETGIFRKFRTPYTMLFIRAKFVLAYSNLHIKLKSGRKYRLLANYRRAAKLLNSAAKSGFSLSRADILAAEILGFSSGGK